MVSRTTVSPDLICSTGSCALSNQPHCVVSSVAGNRCMVLPPGSGIERSLGSAGPEVGCGIEVPGDFCSSAYVLAAATRATAATAAKTNFIDVGRDMATHKLAGT